MQGDLQQGAHEGLALPSFWQLHPEPHHPGSQQLQGVLEGASGDLLTDSVMLCTVCNADKSRLVAVLMLH